MKILICLKLLSCLVGVILSIMTDYSKIINHSRLHFIIMSGCLMYILVDLCVINLLLVNKVLPKEKE